MAVAGSAKRGGSIRESYSSPVFKSDLGCLIPNIRSEEKKNMSLTRRDLLRYTAYSAGAVTLAACAPKAEPTAAPAAAAPKA
jgi:hypothetical protein